MYRWYKAANICYAYLSDYDMTWGPPDTLNEISPYLDKNRPGFLGLEPCTDIQSHIKHSRWFTRGWTLQELIAPKNLHFFDRGWRFIASRSRIVHELESITGIHSAVLSRQTLYFTRDDEFWLSKYSIAQRMHWASKRKTTRKEDEAYSLLGIFGINMPLLYGEGVRAFQRLQEEIIRTSTDQTILAWEPLPDGSDLRYSGHILAYSPANFWWHAHNITSISANDSSEIRLTSAGVEIELCLEKFRLKYGYDSIIGRLGCAVFESQRDWSIGIRLQVLSQSTRPGRRFATKVAHKLTSSIEESAPSFRRLILLPLYVNDGTFSTDKILISHLRSRRNYTMSPLELAISLVFLRERQESENGGWVLDNVYPRSQWHAAMAKMILPLKSTAYGAVAMTRKHEEVVIVFGGVAPTSNDIDHADVPRESLCQCWILEKPPSWKFDWRSSAADHCLERLCDRASKLSALDYFERSSSRRDSHKWIRLRDSQIARLKVSRGPRFNHNIHLLYETTQVQDPGWTKDSGPLADRDYFQLEELSKPEKIIPSARQRSNGNSSIKQARFAI